MSMFRDIVREYYSGPNKRYPFGQFFVSRYVRSDQVPVSAAVWPELYYCDDTELAMEMARDFLTKGIQRYD